MGIFDFFRKQPAEPPPPTPEPEFEPDDKGPSIHYVLAHYALRQLALQDPLRYLSILASPQARDFLQAVLDDVSEGLTEERRFTAEDLYIHPGMIGEFPCAIVEFPPPAEMTEVHFTALVAFVDLDAELPPPEEVRARYFTLERGMGIDDKPRTVLCEWTTGSHLNFGDGPPPTLRGFIEALEKLKPAS